MAHASPSGPKKGKSVSTFAKPDFAFPKTVEKDALPRFRDALSRGDGPEALKGAIQVVVARNLVSSSSFNENAAMLDSAAKAIGAPYSPLFYLLEANLYRQLYEAGRWNYNRRTLPQDSVPENPLAWDRGLFRSKILGLIDKAASAASDAARMPIGDLAGAITNEEEARRFGLSVYDFIVYNSAACLSPFAEERQEALIPFRTDGSRGDMTVGEKCAATSRALLDALTEFREKAGEEAPLAVALLEKSKTISQTGTRLAFLNGWKDRLINSEWDALLLHACFGLLPDGEAQRKELYSQMKGWLGKFPNAPGSGDIRADLAEMEQTGVRLELPDEILPDTPAKGKAWLTNTGKAYVIVYRLGGNMALPDQFNISKFPASCTKVASIPISAEGSVPFKGECDFETPSLPAGKYVFVPSESPELRNGWRKKTELWSVGTVNVTGISIITLSNSAQKDSGRVYVVDARSQKPLEGVLVTLYENGFRKAVKSGRTDTDGSFYIGDGNYNLTATFNGSSAETWYGSHYYSRTHADTARGNILTDLAIYKPGSELQFAFVGWTRHEKENILLRNEEVTIWLRDANYNKTDSLNLTTDSDGRCSGRFQIPLSGLLGTYTLEAAFRSKPSRTVCRAAVEVAEYKTPGFLVEVRADSARNYKAGDVIEFRGKASTYSGMPLGDASVSYKVSWQPWWRIWNGGASGASYGGTLSAGGKGEFVISLPTENLRGTEFEYGIYSLEVTATSPSGETQSAPAVRFALGKGFSINPAIEGKTCAEGDEISFHVPVYDMLGLPTAQKVEYSITDVSSDRKVAEGTFVSPSLSVPATQLPSGEYRLTFNVEGDSVTASATTAIWRKSDTKPPYATPLWITQTKVTVPDGAASAEIKVGSGFEGSYILAVISSPGGIVSRRWMRVDDENTTLTVDSPVTGGRSWVTFSGMHYFKRETAVVTIIPESAERELEVKTETFRDRISSGDREKWNFRFTTDGKCAGEIPAFAVMSDKALNALAPFSWSFSVGRNYYYNSTNLSSAQPGIISVTGVVSGLPRFKRMGSPIPGWNTYGYGMAGPEEIFNTVKTTSLRLRGAGAVMSARNEMYDTAEEEPRLYAAPAPAMESMKMAKAEDSLEESAEADSGAAGENGNEKTELRPVDMPLAFFMPALKSDADGNVSVDFDVPNFNTTWQFQIMGYTADLLTAGIVKDAVASKEVMVKSNPPRYLRTGDKAVITALIFNNSDREISLGGEITLIDPRTGKVLVSKNLGAAATPPSGNRLMAVEFDVPSDLSGVVMQAYARGNRHSDGEQTLIPILPSSTPVVESTQFYLGRGSRTFSQKLPKYDAGANLTLKYCDNPIWECVLALPSIAKPESKNVLSLMKALYANSVATGITEKYPAVKSGLEKALAAKDAAGESSLKSNLEKDASLKTVELQATPWVNDAAAETQRMKSLGTLLDTTSADAAVSALVEDVKSLQKSDGGWSWCPEMKSSVFISRKVLQRFGMMSKTGVLPRGCDAMVRNGIAYCDKEAVRAYTEAKHKFSTTDMLEYLYIRSFFSAGNGGSGFAGLRTKALKAIADEWSGFSVYEKAIAATLLSRSEGYGRTARVILESLSQYASKSESKGWWFDNLTSGRGGWSKLTVTAAVLEAYAEIEPSSPAVDGLRQWLVLQKETEDWGSDSNTVGIISAVLSSGSDWTAAGEMPAVTLGGRRVALPEGELPSGIVTVTLLPKEASGKELKIEKTSDAPAWGGVISQYVAPIDEVKAEKCETLQLEKRMVVIDNTSGGERASDGPVKVGDRVRVTLTLTCDKDMNYVALTDERGACLEPAEQLSGYAFRDGLAAYREVRDSKTSFFIEFLPKGVNVITYDCFADREGIYSTGIATVQSQYSPLQTAHSAGSLLTVTP